MKNSGSKYDKIVEGAEVLALGLINHLKELVKELKAYESDDCVSDYSESDDSESDDSESEDNESEDNESEDNESDDIENVRYDKHTDTEFPLETPPSATLPSATLPSATPPSATPPLVGKPEAFNSPIIAESDKALDPLTPFLDTSPILFRITKSPCYNYIKNGRCTVESCKYIHKPPSLIRYLELIESAKENLDICAYNITSNDIYKTILKVQESGVTVRVITDAIEGTTDRSLIKKLPKSIKVRVNAVGKEERLMHNKFVIIDNKLLLTGSFNLTTKGAYYNYENVFVSKNSRMITYYITEFKELWTDFKDNPLLEKNPSNANNRDTKTHIFF